jgi:hypothetical protein
MEEVVRIRWQLSTHIGGVGRVLVGHGGVAHGEGIVVFVVAVDFLLDGWGGDAVRGVGRVD